MKKNLITLAVAAALASPLTIQAADSASVSGFAEINYVNYGDTGTGSNAFGANGEVDFQATKGAVTVRVDVDLTLATDTASTGNDSARIEQAFFAWKAMDAVTVIGGVFNNPLGQEANDVTDIEFITHSAVWNIFNGQTVLNDNNIAGVAVAGGNEMFTGTLAVLNDLQHATDTDGTMKNSIAAVLNANPIEGLALELGYVTQETGAENVLDFNAQYGIDSLTVGVDVLMADAGVDTAYNVWAGFAINDKAAIKARYEAVSFENTAIDDTTRMTVYGSYDIEENLSVALQYSSGDNASGEAVSGIMDDTAVRLQFIGTF